ncbi:J domain-containing protein [Enterovibrio sp. ZSDZ35]|uniref:J domain-containing protein n=1 Tax=Enterovibrio qingdaonensis TaxID=2899818 RepID=A0ABT5QG62_9GAMM|nr:J domain-containing protein [Enterovibrio sp. ZSDZ35]MDD1779968.1 J domain-containing protein [Enterovibrio sp. ZSDZ35]
MTIWETLGIEETHDETAIKKAYRKQLRIHHPEDDPEGFQRVRRAYEEALASISSQSESDPDTQLSIAQSDEQQNIELAEIGQFDAILANAEQRMALDCWRVWAESVMLLAIDQQEEISLYALRTVMANRWLPPPIVNVLWESLGWQTYLKGSEEQQEVGEFIDDWRQQAFTVSLEELKSLEHAEQRAMLGFLRPLEIALSIGQPDAIDYLFSQQLVSRHCNHIETQLLLLRGGVACGLTSDSFLQQLVAPLCSLPAQTLSLKQWDIVASAVLLFGREDLVVLVIERLLKLKAYPEVADLLFQSTVGIDDPLPICAAFLRQQWMPLPTVYWRTERRFVQPNEKTAESRLFHWLHGQLMNQDNGNINHRLDLLGLPDFWHLVGGALWAGHSGSWAWLRQLSESIKSAQEHKSGRERTLLILAERWVKEALGKAKGCDTLLLKLSAYESDAMFSAEPLSYEEISSLSKSDWLECIRRHPLIPDSWFSQLEDAEIIVFEELRDESFFPHYADALCFYRAINKDVNISHSWAETPFDGMFDWTLWFYSHLAAGGEDKQEIIRYLSDLPETQREHQIGLLLPFAEQPDVYLPDAVQAFNRYPEQFVYRLIVDRQVTLLENKSDTESLVEMAKKGDLLATMALSRRLIEDNFDEAVVLWNLVAAASSHCPHLQAVVDWQQQNLLTVRDEQDLVKESYEYSKPEFLHAMLTTNKTWFSPTSQIEENDPVEESKSFHYPMVLLLTQLHLGLSEADQNLLPLKELSNRRLKQTPLQQDITDIAVFQLQDMYQRKLDQDIEAKGEKAATYSKKRLTFLSVALFFAWIFVFPMSVLRLPTFEMGSVIVASVLMTIMQGLLIWQISRPINEKSNKNKYIGYSLFTYFAALLFKSPFLALVNVFTHFYTVSHLSPLYVNGGWNRIVVATRSINMRKVLGFKDKEN